MRWYVGAWPDYAVGYSTDIPFYDIQCICVITHLAYNLVDGEFTVVFHTLLGALFVIASRVVFDLVVGVIPIGVRC